MNTILRNITQATYCDDPMTIQVYADVTYKQGDVELREDGVLFYYRADDVYSGDYGKSVGDWLAANSNQIKPYVAPSMPTVEEMRAKMPALTSRQFWMAAANIGEFGTDKEVIITAIKAQLPDTVDRKMMIAELESSTFERLNPTIVEVMTLMEIPAEQVDALWTWAASL